MKGEQKERRKGEWGLDAVEATKNSEQLNDIKTYNAWVKEQWIQMWVENAARSYHVIEQKFNEKNCDIHELRDRPQQPALLIGSGPSLDDMVPYLKDWKGVICCSTSHLSLMTYLGIEPDFVFLLDADPLMTYLLTQYDAKNTKTILLTHPSIQREAIEAWTGEVRFFRMHDPGEQFFSAYLPRMYKVINREKGWGIGTHVLNSGNVANAMAVISSHLNLHPIFFCGIDLGFPEGKYRFTNYEMKDGEWVTTPSPPIPENRPVVLAGNGVPTDQVSLFYKQSFMVMYGLLGGPRDWISCSRGALYELPYAHPADVVARQGQGFEDLIVSELDAYKIAQSYLEPRGTYILKTGGMVSVTSTEYLPWWKHLHFWYTWYKNRRVYNWQEEAQWAAKKYLASIQRWRQRVYRGTRRLGFTEDSCKTALKQYDILPHSMTPKERHDHTMLQVKFIKDRLASATSLKEITLTAKTAAHATLAGTTGPITQPTPVPIDKDAS